MASNIKKNGVVYTPEYLVKIILDQSGYLSKKILKKHIIDNSCGDGKFLIEIVKRYIHEFRQNRGINASTILELKSELECYIHGIELDGEELNKCILNLNEIISSIGLESVKWDIKQGDTLKTAKYDGMMDFVVGNPPYVRVHNLSNNFEYIKNQKFSGSGMTDLFIVFYEIGIKMLNDTGVLCYITPSSIFNSVAGSKFREYVISNNLLTAVIDLKHFQAFENFMTYTAILKLDKINNSNKIEYSIFNEQSLNKQIIEYLNYNEFYLNDFFYLSDKVTLQRMKSIIDTDIKKKDIEVKNGFATLADGVFIKEKFDFNSKFIKRVIKASRKKWYQVIYPYDKNGQLVKFEDFEPELQSYFLANKHALDKRSLDKNTEWYGFGRTQGINDFYKSKISINSLLRTKDDIKLEFIEPDEGIYSGLYIVGKVDYNIVKSILISDDFVDYISTLGKYKSGGYYTFSSSDLKKYIIYKLGGN